MASNDTRIATVTDESSPLLGQRFIVQQWRGETVHCWGQVSSYRGGSIRHGESLAFDQSTVRVEDYTGDRKVLAKGLFEQTVDDMVRRGAIITGRGRNLIITRRPYAEHFVAMAKELGVDVRYACKADLDAVAELAGEL